MRDCAYRTATAPGSHAFIAQVRASSPEVPNFCPTMKMTFGASGSAASCARVHQVALDRLDPVGLEPRLEARRWSIGRRQ